MIFFWHHIPHLCPVVFFNNHMYAYVPHHPAIPFQRHSPGNTFIVADQAVNFVLESFRMSNGGELFVPKIPSMKITDLAKAISPESELVETGIRPGEKLHETLMSLDEMRHVWEVDNKFVILSSKRIIGKESSSYPNITKTESQKSYSSDLAEKIPLQDLKRIISESFLLKKQL